MTSKKTCNCGMYVGNTRFFFGGGARQRRREKFIPTVQPRDTSLNHINSVVYVYLLNIRVGGQ